MQIKQRMDIRIGTSGYSFDDWRGSFYPATLDKGKLLDHYARFFPTVEINSTYYGIPSPNIVANWAKKVPDGFEFMIKVPQSLTHRRSDFDDDLAKFAVALEPLQASGKFTGLLAQFPYSFKFNHDSLDYVSLVCEALAPRPLFVEFRHRSWVNRTMYDRLRREGTGYVCVDEPSLPNLLDPDLFATTATGYIRLHGRNAEQWWDGGALRYDYKYSHDELEEWRQKIERMKTKGNVRKLFIFFNNCHLGQAATNALEMKEMLGL